jgi:hypothetical protein
MSSPSFTAPSGALRLRDWGVICASGVDAASFLQGQLTNDVAGLGSGSARLAGYCSAKGRLLATFVVWRSAEGDLLLACSADLLAPTLKRLSMFVLRAKCRLTDASAELPLWGVVGVAAEGLLTDHALGQAWRAAPFGEGRQLVRLPDARIEGCAFPRLLLAGAGAEPQAPLLDEAAWRWLEVHSGTARITAATTEQFVPQMVNLDLVGGVSFQKGCYPGQEVVARSQYRGTLKRRGYVVEADAALQPAQEVFDEADPTQPAGMVVLGGEHADSFAGLVELKISAAESGALHLGSAEGPRLRVSALPYELPSLVA